MFEALSIVVRSKSSRPVKIYVYTPKSDKQTTTIGCVAVLYMGNCESGSILCESDSVYQHLELTNERAIERQQHHMRCAYLNLVFFSLLPLYTFFHLHREAGFASRS